MGQSSSTHGSSIHRRTNRTPTPTRSVHQTANLNDAVVIPTEDSKDFISELPDECLGSIFQSLSSGDRKNCSLVCKRWLTVESQTHHRLSLTAPSSLLSSLPSLLSRFDSVTTISLRCDRRSISIGDDSLTLISLRCRKLSQLKLRGCRQITDLGISAVAQNSKNLKKFSVGSCSFGSKAINSLLHHSSSLEHLSIKRLRRLLNDGDTDEITPGAASSSIKYISLKELYNGQCFNSLITGSYNLRTLKLLRCSGDWDKTFEMMAKNQNNSLVELHLERVQVSDNGLLAISNCLKLEILHLIKTPECTDSGIVYIAENCKSLRKVHIDGWRTNRMGDEGLISISKNCSNLQELVLIGVNPNSISLEALATNCRKLERLALCGSETIGDVEVSCVAAKCVALKKFCIKGCPVSDEGIEKFAWGCPNLVKIKVRKCNGVSSDVGDWLRVKRESLVVNLDVCEVEGDGLDASASDGGVQEDSVMEFSSIVGQVGFVAADAPSSSNARRSFFKSRFGLFGGRTLVPCAFRRGSSTNSNNSF